MAKGKIPTENDGIEREANVQAVGITGYDETSKRFKAIKLTADGGIKTSPVAGFSAYESKALAVGADADGYDVKNTGSMFGTVTTSYRTIITNNDSAEDITIYLNTDGTNPVVIGSQSTFEVTLFGVTNIFVDTTASQSGTVEIVIFG